MSSPSIQCRELIEAMEAFVSGSRRSRDDVKRMEDLFATSPLDDDQRFSDLQLALALFGAGGREHDERMLASECRYALRLLHENVAGSPPPKKSSLGFLLAIAVGLFGLFFVLPALQMWWPPASVERLTQRRRLTERVQLAGGWDAIRRDCVALTEQHTNGFIFPGKHDTNLPPAIVALKPLLVGYDPVSGRVSMRILTGGPYLGLEVVTKTVGHGPLQGIQWWCDRNHCTFREVAEGIYEIY